ncbi:hypothetical protein HGA34_01675 [Candidatus Falkowbacteria bacterium]|nr:hypothetical protein [Candidatus Falkowbacteria bacterium]
MKNLTPTQKQIIISIAWLLPLMLGSFLVGNVYAKKIKKINNDNEQKKVMLSLLKTQTDSESRLSAQIKMTKNFDAELKEAIPAASNLSPITDAIGSLAQKYGIASSISVSGPQATDKMIHASPLYRMDLKATLSNATVGSFQKLLSDLEGQPYFFSVDSFSFKSASGSGWHDNSSITLIGHFYAENRVE